MCWLNDLPAKQRMEIVRQVHSVAFCLNSVLGYSYLGVNLILDGLVLPWREKAGFRDGVSG